jgi:hypothetical protein
MFDEAFALCIFGKQQKSLLSGWYHDEKLLFPVKLGKKVVFTVKIWEKWYSNYFDGPASLMILCTAIF